MYQRFLNNDDYSGLLTDEALYQLTRGKDLHLAKAEEAAEESIIEYLSEHYEIENALAVGKNLLPYNKQITYPVGSHFYLNGKIYKATRVLKGQKAPSLISYWSEVEAYSPKLDDAPPYTQRGTYLPGDIVSFSNRWYQCVEYNGLEYGNVQVPGVEAWEEVQTYAWEPNNPYAEWDVVRYQNAFYALLNTELTDWTINPLESDNWGLVGSYDASYNNYELSPTEYVEFEGSLFHPKSNPNADMPQEGLNIIEDDPRHPNIKKHLLRLAVYELHKLVSPNNVSSTRVTDYETSIMWLRDAARFKINPQISRKIDNENKPAVGFATATFMRDYDPHKNPWHI